MILKQHKIIFVHIPKTAGQSVTEFLLNNMNMSSKNIKKNRPEVGFIKNTNRKLPGPNWYHHLFLNEYLKFNLISEDDIKDYFIFTICRNPYDRFRSAFYYNKLDKTFTYDTFVKNFKIKEDDDLSRHFLPQMKYIESNKFKVDKIFHLEKNFKEEFTIFFQKKFNFLKPLNNVNVTATKKLPLTKYTQDFINEFYQDDFHYFNYEIMR